jgi:hypothetical protein
VIVKYKLKKIIEMGLSVELSVSNIVVIFVLYHIAKKAYELYKDFKNQELQ